MIGTSRACGSGGTTAKESPGSTAEPSPKPRLDVFAAETAVDLLRGVRLGVLLAISIIPSFVFVDFLYLPAGTHRAAVLRGTASVLLAGLLAATYLRAAPRLASLLASATVLVLSLMIAGLATLSSGIHDPYYVLQVMGLIFVVMGTGQLFPLSGPATLGLVSIPFVLHLLYALRFGFVENLPFLISTLSAMAIATVGAAAAHRHRIGEYEGRLAKESLHRARGEFMAMITHDIRNPLSVIAGYVEALRDGEPLTQDVLDALDRANRRALTLAANFLSVSKLEGGAAKLHREPTDVSGLLRQAIDNQRRLADGKGLTFVETIADMPAAELDDVQFDRVLANLLGNAIEYSDPGTRILVASRPADDGMIEIEIANTGEPLGPDRLATLFRKYDPLAHRKASSTGLGLYIVKTITEAHGGSVVAEPVEGGRGTRFRVRIPTAAPAPERPCSTPSRAEPPAAA